MTPFWRRRGTRAAKQVPAATLAHLQEFVATRRGIEAWVEEATGFNRTSILLVAGDGEWTRREVPSEQWAADFAKKQGIRAYPAGVVGYPQRMREWDQRHKNDPL